jgi:predicted secreted protein
MNVVSAIVVYVVLWWLVLFMVLPWGVKRVESPGQGQDPGAPEKPMLWRKAAITTLIATILFGIVYAVVTSDLLPLREMFKPKV